MLQHMVFSNAHSIEQLRGENHKHSMVHSHFKRTLRFRSVNHGTRLHFIDHAIILRVQVQVRVEHNDFVHRAIEKMLDLGVVEERSAVADDPQFGIAHDQILKKSRGDVLGVVNVQIR